MIASLLVPAALAVVSAFTAGWLQRRLRPAVGVPVLTALAVVSAAASLWAIGLLAIGFLAQLSWVVERAGWCQQFLSSHDRVPGPLGAAALVALPVMSARVVLGERRRRAALQAHGGPAGVDVLPTDVPVAHAVPGRPGRVVVSLGLLRRLEPDERQVVLAHEQAHLDLRHDRFLRLGDASARAVPVLVPLVRQLRFATERWADEAAAEQLGDRQLVARAIARAALVGTAPAPAMGVGGTGVADRVKALIAPAPGRSWAGAAVFVSASAALVTLASATLQLHHLVAYAAHVCRLS